MCFYGWALSLTLRENHRMRVFKKMVLRRTLDLREMKWQEAEDCIMRSLYATPNII
jgi:hypothetical protein